MIIALLIGLALFAMVEAKDPTITNDDEQLVKKYCENGSAFEDTKDFERFVSAYNDQINKDSSPSNELLGPFFRSSEMLKKCHRDREAITRLGQLINSNEQDDVCQPKHIDLMTNYYNGFIKDAELELKSQEKLNSEAATRKMPIVRNLFTTYALQVSYICKRNLLSNLHQELRGRNLIAHSKLYNELTPWLRESTADIQIDTIGKQPQDFDDLLIPDLLELDPNRIDVVYLHKSSQKYLDKMNSVCEKVRPIYETTIMPVLRLAKLGYSFRTQVLNDKVAELRRDTEAKRMYTATQICEIFNKIHLKPTDKYGFNKYLITTGGNQRNREIWYPELPRHSPNSFGPGSEFSKFTILAYPEYSMFLEEIKPKKPEVKSENLVKRGFKLLKEKTCFRCASNEPRIEKKMYGVGRELMNRRLGVMLMFDAAIAGTYKFHVSLLSDILDFLTSEPYSTRWEDMLRYTVDDD